LVARYGKRTPAGYVGHHGLSHVFPAPETLAAAGSLGLDMPMARQRSLTALADAALADADLFRPFGTIEQAIERFRAIRGVGEWTAQYIALRALRETDAFPASDAGLLRAARMIEGIEPTPSALLSRAESWRPWRAYAAQHLWIAHVPVISTARTA
jgi:AraC family transcriptional regulator, regulatory protein of adaptative response / DNA-3-methyladenine glycosylase II